MKSLLVGWYNFTTLGATGKNGPVSAAGYNSTLLKEVKVTNGVQEWQVPITGKCHVEACGASGGDGILPKKGNKGAKVCGVITLLKGEKLAILVGQKDQHRMEATQDVGVGERLFIVHRTNINLSLWLAGKGVVGKKMVCMGTIYRMAVVPLTQAVLTGVVVRSVEMEPLYQTLGLAPVILMTGVALKLASSAAHCIVGKGEVLWAEVGKVP